MRHLGRGPNPERRSNTRGWLRFASFVLVGCMATTSAAPGARSDSPLAPGTRPASTPPEKGTAYEMSGRFALPDESVVGTFRWFDVSPNAARFTPGANPKSLGRVEVRGLETAIVAWFGDEELRIFRSDTPRGTVFSCGCKVALDAAPTPGRVIAEALACMELAVGPSGLEMDVTRELELQGIGPITRAVRGMPGRTSADDWQCSMPGTSITASQPQAGAASLDDSLAP